MPRTFLTKLLQRLSADERTEKVLRILRSGRGVSAGGLWGSSAALLISSLASSGHHFLVIAPSIESADEFADDVSLFLGQNAEIFPSWEVLPQEGTEPDIQILTSRFSLLSLLLRSKGNEIESLPGIVIAPIQAMLQSVPQPSEFSGSVLALDMGKQMSPDHLKGLLVDREFESVAEVELPGQFSSRGGIVDVFPYGADFPVRVEFFGDLIDSLRRFDPATQRSLDELTHSQLVGPSKSEFTWGTEKRGSLVDYLPPETHVAIIEPTEVEQRALRYAGMSLGQNVLPYPDLYRSFRSRGLLLIDNFPVESRRTSVNFDVGSMQAFSTELAGNLAALARTVDEGFDVLVTCANSATRERFEEIISDSDLRSLNKVERIIGRLSRGFRFNDFRVVVISDREVFCRYAERREQKRVRHTRPIDSFIELKQGDYVVHTEHGIGRFVGLRKLERDGGEQDHLVIQYRNRAHLYVPTTRIHLVQRYVGVGGARPVVDRLGGVAWASRKAAAKLAVGDMAKELLSIQAIRERSPGIAYRPDTDWQREFEASFYYEETEDQLAIADQIRADMESAKSMDRLICGDVGYGKTELAMRAAFKAVSDGYQVAVLVPTTILAQQHYKTFTERMADYPVEIEVLSRFRTDREQHEIIQRTERGTVDILIGTHRLIQDDVKFKNLGIVIIDEEQRFGVVHKEKLKKLRRTVDVITMTATPIPRTLHMALLGIKDISGLETPPRDRLAIETRVIRFERGKIREAILQELNRDGQVFFVHNRVYNIPVVAARVQQIVPEARIAIAHGQMHEKDLEQVMADFLDGSIDVLVTTTIIESGLDIPNANTIFINDADMFGLADLHQLRGRVGRYKHKAYAYLLLPEHRPVNPTAQRRLRAIEELSQLGAGFEIALRDLEIRGAGNILGAQQSGHIAAIGYELYCRLLEGVVQRLKGLPAPDHAEATIELGIDEFIPGTFVPSSAGRMKTYRRLVASQTAGEIEALADELRDRFGPLPQPMLNMLELAKLRLSCKKLHIASVRSEEGFLVLASPRAAELASALGSFDPRQVDDEHVYIPLPRAGRGEAAVYLKKILNRISLPCSMSTPTF
jgi:transcription-repair coupling factor (superfamily II helicase)